MEASVISAIIGASATVTAVIIAWWLQQKKSSSSKSVKITPFLPDDDSIYFMQFLLHDAYEQGNPLSSIELAEHHMDYAPLVLEVKLIELEKHGYIQRTNRKTNGIGMWQILPKGVEFMLKNNHQLHDLIQEQRSNA